MKHLFSLRTDQSQVKVSEVFFFFSVLTPALENLMTDLAGLLERFKVSFN